jgi:thiol-disulfide isomerase/thioredoxin
MIPGGRGEGKKPLLGAHLTASRRQVDMRWFAFFAVVGIAAGQCVAPVSRQGLAFGGVALPQKDWEARIAAIREALEKDPDDLFLNRWLIEWQRRPYTGELAEEFRARLAEKPEDRVRRYLYARALIGKDTPAAIEALKKIDSPWSALALEEIFSSAAFRDPAKVAQYLRAFRSACPSNLDGFDRLGVIEDEKDLRELAGVLRGLLQKNAKDVRLWPTLWAAEFRLTPAPELDRARKVVAEDAKRLPPDSAVLGEGYRLSGQMEEEKRWSARIAAARPRDGLSEAIIAWSTEHPWSKDRGKALYAISGEWVKKWPQRWDAWSQRRNALVELQSHSVEDWKEVGAGIARSDYNGDPHSRTSLIAQDWVAAGVMLDLAVVYLRGLLDWAETPAPPVSDLIRGTIAADLDARMRPGFQWVVLVSLVHAELQLKDYQAAHTALDKMRKWLDTVYRENHEQNPMSFPDYEGRYLGWMASLATAEGRKLDALAYRQQLITNPFQMREYGGSASGARELYKELGGTDEGFAVWSKPQPWPADRPEVPRGMPMMPWNSLNRALPEMRVPDYTGRVWTQADFKGKRTFVFLWATWCGPCWQELPGMQKLADAVKGRGDVQAISLSMDENPAMVERFMKEKHYDFPVLVSKAYTELVLPEVMLGQMWVVDGEGRIRLQRQGGPYIEQMWVDEALDKLNHR